MFDQVDVTNTEAMNGLSQRLDGAPIDTLIHNAGVLTQESLEHLDVDAIRWQFEVNALGPPTNSGAAVPCTPEPKSPLSPVGGIYRDNSSGSRYGYRMSSSGQHGRCVHGP